MARVQVAAQKKEVIYHSGLHPYALTTVLPSVNSIRHHHSPCSLCSRCSKTKMHLLASEGADSPVGSPCTSQQPSAEELKLHNVKFTV